jgi:hypothetical protein
MPIGIRNSIWTNLPIFHAIIDSPALSPRGIYAPVYDGMSNMYASWTEFSSKTLANCAHRKFSGCEGTTLCRAFDGGCGAGNYERGRVRRAGNGGEEQGDDIVREVIETVSVREDILLACRVFYSRIGMAFKLGGASNRLTHLIPIHP